MKTEFLSLRTNCLNFSIAEEFRDGFRGENMNPKSRLILSELTMKLFFVFFPYYLDDKHEKVVFGLLRFIAS